MRTINCWLCTVGLVVLCLIALKGTGSFTFGLGTAGSGVSQTQNRQVDAFDSIRVEGVADVNATISDHTELSVTTDDNLLPLIQTTVQNGTLVIKETKNINPKSSIKVTIKTPSLKSTAISGAGDIQIHGLNESSFTVNISGAGNLRADGSVEKLSASLSGAGDLKLNDLIAKDSTITVSGTGSAKINSTDTLDVSISGMGSVVYKGLPKLTEHVSGMGSVTRVK